MSAFIVRPGAAAIAAVLAASFLSACRDATGPGSDGVHFGAPVVGVPMVDVFYGAYMDHDPGSEVVDYACGTKTYDDHRGVDILLRNFQVQDEGVETVAAASGVVSLARDGMPDRNTSWDVGGGFGNHVVVTHTDGAQSIYAHLRRNSIAVSLGTQVEPGTVLGLVGSSGRSNWPHLHFEVQRDGDVFDPFAGECGANESLWLEQLPYQDEFLVTDAGITDLDAGTFAVLLERPPTLSRFPLDVESFRFWIQLANQSDARVRMELREPGGETWTLADGRVSATFSMRYLTLRIPVAGALTEAGEWEIRTFQDDQLIWTEPFTLDPPVAAVEDRDPPVMPQVAVEFDVLDQTPSKR